MKPCLDNVTWKTLPHMDLHTGDTDEVKKRCQYIYWNLLEIPDGKQLPRADAYVRELFQTKRCQSSTMDKVLEAYCEYITPDSLDRLIRRKPDDDDRQVAEDAVSHYQKWTRERTSSPI